MFFFTKLPLNYPKELVKYFWANIVLVKFETEADPNKDTDCLKNEVKMMK